MSRPTGLGPMTTTSLRGSGVAQRFVVTRSSDGGATVAAGVELDCDGYEAWVAGYDANGAPKGRLRTDEKRLCFVEVVVNGPKTAPGRQPPA